ncbi:hypothetical protein [Azospirillum argentinense]
MPDTDMPDLEYLEEFGHINLGVIDSCLNDDDRKEFHKHVKLFGVSDEVAESLIEEIDVCLKKETTRQINAITTPSTSETRRDIKMLLKASSDFLHIYYQAHNYSDYLLDLELESNNSLNMHSIIEGVEALKVACEAALINLRGPKSLFEN